MLYEENDHQATYYGKYKGFVRDNNDDEGRGRLRLYCPQVMGIDSDHEDGWLGWAEPNFPWMGGINSMDFGVPPTAKEAGEEIGVWVEFEAGHVDHPIWTGCFTVAPRKDGRHDRLSPQDLQAASPGGSLVAGAGNVPGASVDAINPPKGRPGVKETAIWVKKGRDIIIGSREGGAIVIGPSGVQLVGPFVRANGRTIDASLNIING
jgi:hypothetical protein